MRPLSQNPAQQPPHRFDERVVEGVVGLAHVHPETHAFGHPLPVADVAHHGLAAPAGELRHPDLALDLGLVEDPELLLDLVLDRQTVGVPSGLARAVVALHVLEAGKDVLERAREDVMDPRPSVRGRRSLVPAVQGPALAAALRLVEYVVLAPQGEHLLLEPYAVVAARYVFEPHRISHRRCSPKNDNAPRTNAGRAPCGRSHSIESRGDGSAAPCAGEVAVPPGFTRASRREPRTVTARPRERGRNDPGPMTGAGRPSLPGRAQGARSVGGSGAIFTGGAVRSSHHPPLARSLAGPATPPLHSLCDRRDAAIHCNDSATEQPGAHPALRQIRAGRAAITVAAVPVSWMCCLLPPWPCCRRPRPENGRGCSAPPPRPVPTRRRPCEGSRRHPG